MPDFLLENLQKSFRHIDGHPEPILSIYDGFRMFRAPFTFHMRVYTCNRPGERLVKKNCYIEMAKNLENFGFALGIYRDPNKEN